MAVRVAAAVLAVLVAAAACVSSAQAVQYDQHFAFNMVYLSAAAYCEADEVQSWSCPACVTPGFNVTRVVSDSSLNLQGYVGINTNSSSGDQAIVVAFRGTQSTSIKNWIVDLESIHSSTTYPDCSGCEVEDGFYKAHQALVQQVVPEVHTLRALYPSAPVWVTGHSLGAAMAVLSAAHLQTRENVTVDQIYTFGLPRVGNTHFSDFYRATLPQAVHVVHYHDIVPHLPPRKFSYHHIPTEVWYDNESGLTHKTCNGSGEDPSCSDGVHFWDFSVTDHFTYLDVSICGCKPITWPPPYASTTTAAAGGLRGAAH